jgi:hypothetical protein
MGNSLPAFDPDFAGPAQWATMYRAIGLQVIPGWLPGEPAGNAWKRPYLSHWQPLQEALVPQAQFERWYGPNGEHAGRGNMGLITGRCSGNAFMIDLDTHRHPEAAAWWNAVLEVENSGLDLETIEQRTGGGGIQKLFLAPPGFVVPTIKTSIGVDIRGQGGFAVLPPSLHESGQHYDWLPGRAPWEIAIEVAPDWLLEAIVDLAEAHGGGVAIRSPEKEFQTQPHSHTSGEQVVNEFGTVIDGREHLMRDVVWHAVLELYRAAPIKPQGAELEAAMEASWASYEMKVATRVAGADKLTGLAQEDRGRKEFGRKWKRVLRLWDSPKMKAEAAKPPPVKRIEDPAAEFQQAAEQAEAAAKIDPNAIYPFLDVRGIKATADPIWLLLDMIPEKVVGFLYGPPGCLKTFIALDMGLSMATGREAWWERKIGRKGAVIYISSEGIGGLKFRLMAWEQHRQVNADDAPFYLIKETINFMIREDIGKLIATVQAIKDLAQTEILAVFVDTVSRVLPGAEENQQKDMTIFVAACDAVRQRFDATVIGIHHTNRQGGFRGSSVMPGAGDFLIEVRREPGAMDGSIFAQKIKDAPDGWEQFFKVTKVTLSDTFGLPGKTSLALDLVAYAPKREPQTRWPDTSICQQILAAIDEEWGKGRPWCYARNSSRCALPNIMKRWQLKRDVVEDMLATWTANEMIAEELCDAKNHITGYRKLRDI